MSTEKKGIWFEGMTPDQARANWYNNGHVPKLLERDEDNLWKGSALYTSITYGEKKRKNINLNLTRRKNKNKYYVVLNRGERGAPFPDGENGLLKNAIKLVVERILDDTQLEGTDPIVISFIALGLRDDHAANYSCRIDRRGNKKAEILIKNTLGSYERCDNEAMQGFLEVFEAHGFKSREAIKLRPGDNGGPAQTCHSCIGLACEMAMADEVERPFHEQFQNQKRKLKGLCGDENELTMRKKHYEMINDKQSQKAKKPAVTPEKENAKLFEENKEKVKKYLEGKGYTVDVDKKDKKSFTVFKDETSVFSVTPKGITASEAVNEEEVYKGMIEAMVRLYLGQKFEIKHFSKEEEEKFKICLSGLGKFIQEKFIFDKKAAQAGDPEDVSDASNSLKQRKV